MMFCDRLLIHDLSGGLHYLFSRHMIPNGYYHVKKPGSLASAPPVLLSPRHCLTCTSSRTLTRTSATMSWRTTPPVYELSQGPGGSSSANASVTDRPAAIR